METHLQLAAELSTADRALINSITSEKSSQVSSENKTRPCSKFQCLHTAQHHSTTSAMKAVVNLSNTPLGDAIHSDLAKGLNFAISPLVLPTADILGSVEKAVSMLQEEAAEEI
jgi:hypothetical protein